MIKCLPVSALSLMLISCEAVPSACPDLTPIENGLRFLGVALVVAVLVAVLGITGKGGSK